MKILWETRLLDGLYEEIVFNVSNLKRQMSFILCSESSGKIIPDSIPVTPYQIKNSSVSYSFASKFSTRIYHFTLSSIFQTTTTYKNRIQVRETPTQVNRIVSGTNNPWIHSRLFILLHTLVLLQLFFVLVFVKK